MAVIGILVGEGGVRDEIVRQLSRHGEVRDCSSVASAIDDHARGRIQLLITTIRDEHGESISRTMIAVAARVPTMPVIIYDRITRSSAPTLRAALVPGLHIDCAVRPVEPLSPLIRQMLGPTLPAVVAPILVQRLLRIAPPALWPFLLIAALKAPSRRGFDELARWTGVTPRTIERRLQRARWAPAHVLLQACRALDVLWLMTEYGWTVRRVQRARGIEFASAVTRLTQRYGGVTPREVREGIDFRRVLESVVQRITAPAS